MGIRSLLSKPLAAWVMAGQRRWMEQGADFQHKCFKNLLKSATPTSFGEDHDFSTIQTIQEFQQQVPPRDYEQLKPYFDRVVTGEADVLWKGKPLYLCKTSGTTSGAKYIPVTRESMPNHINGARDALLNYIYYTGNSDFLDGKLIFLSGSPKVDTKGGIPTGRLSGIVNHHVPAYLRSNQMPSYATNCMEDWEQKVDAIVEETLSERMTLISGIPPWVQMYFDKIRERTGKDILEVFPDFSLLVYGGVNFEPYRKKLFQSIGGEVDSIELYPASEGFFAFQDLPDERGLLLLLNSGIFYEFIPVEEYFNEQPTRLTIDRVTLGVNYALLITSNAGLWAYSIGDTIKFVSKNPYRIVVTGRIKHFISAFGEHVIGEEVDRAMDIALQKHTEVSVVEFTVAPQVNPESGLPLHEWYVEFDRLPGSLSAFEKELNLQLQKLNSYYYDLITGNVLRPLRIITLRQGAFKDYMKSIGKLGGQNKVPRLSNDRNIAEKLMEYQTI